MIGRQRGVNIGAMFEGNIDGTGVLYLRSMPTRFEVSHELAHILDFRHSPQNFIRWGSTDAAANLAREQSVFNRFQQHSRIWHTFNPQERAAALRYIDSIGGQWRYNAATGTYESTFLLRNLVPAPRP